MEWVNNRHSETRCEILDILARSGGPMTPSDIYDLIPHLSQGTVRRQLQKMVRDGQIARIYHGQYQAFRPDLPD